MNVSGIIADLERMAKKLGKQLESGSRPSFQSLFQSSESVLRDIEGAIDNAELVVGEIANLSRTEFGIPRQNLWLQFWIATALYIIAQLAMEEANMLMINSIDEYQRG